MKTNTFLVFAATVAAAIHSTNAQLIINGGFETPDTLSYVNIYPGQNTIAPWVAGLNSVEVVQGVGNGFVDIPAFEGAQFLDLNGAGRGRLTQAFATTPGSLYTLTFAYANNFYADPSATASATVRVLDGLGDRLNQTITHIGSVAGDLNWTVFTAQFTALQNTTSLEFTSLTDVDDYSGGIYLDAVQVFESTNAQLIINGSFESPDTPTYMYIDAGRNTLAPWVIPGPNPVEVGDAVGNGFITAPAFEGVQMLDLHGRLRQAFATTPGSLYTVTFAYADHPVEPATPAPAKARVRLFDGLGDRLNRTFTHTGSVSNDLHWTVFNGQFTAVTNTTTLEFTPLTSVPSGLPGGILLDAVQVTLALQATLVLQGSSAILDWKGGVPPYRVQRATNLTAGDWTDVLTNAIPPLTLTLGRPPEFYRIVGQ